MARKGVITDDSKSLRFVDRMLAIVALPKTCHQELSVEHGWQRI